MFFHGFEGELFVNVYGIRPEGAVHRRKDKTMGFRIIDDVQHREELGDIKSRFRGEPRVKVPEMIQVVGFLRVDGSEHPSFPRSCKRQGPFPSRRKSDEALSDRAMAASVDFSGSILSSTQRSRLRPYL